MKDHWVWKLSLCLLGSTLLNINAAHGFLRIKSDNNEVLTINHKQAIFYNIYDSVPFQNVSVDTFIDMLESQYAAWALAAKNVLIFSYFGLTLEDASYVRILNNETNELDYIHTHRVFQEDWSTLLSLSKTAIAVTLVYNEGDKIVDADIVYNNFRYQFCDEVQLCLLGNMHLPSIVLHEVGHQLGFDHQDENESIMNAQIGSKQIRNLTEDDESGAVCSYAQTLIPTEAYLNACSFDLDENNVVALNTPSVTSNPTQVDQPIGSSCGSLSVFMNQRRPPPGQGSQLAMGQPIMLWVMCLLLLSWMLLRQTIAVSTRKRPWQWQ